MSDQTAMPAPTVEDALQLLRNDHARLRALFGDYAMLSGSSGAPGVSADRQALLARIAVQLRAHLRIEQELFYPALQGIVGSARLQRSLDDHGALEARLNEVAVADPLDDGFDARVAALADAVHEHLASEEAEVFPPAERLDLRELGTRMSLRRGALLGDLGMD